MKIRISNQILQYGAVIKVSKVYGKLFRYLKLTTFADFFHVLSSFLVSKTERGVLYTKKKSHFNACSRHPLPLDCKEFFVRFFFFFFYVEFQFLLYR